MSTQRKKRVVSIRLTNEEFEAAFSGIPAKAFSAFARSTINKASARVLDPVQPLAKLQSLKASLSLLEGDLARLSNVIEAVAGRTRS